ncbi:MAG TPA: 4-(cytidine 5'-diphospho)-2-C-methyl-D-erythritol kinase [Chitinophagaceae bacterium]|nr:4-(cytidine 5'-diphospho)-2-C-methyl-D-erythritol kinase [Chitinophagaceae bacterium]
MVTFPNCKINLGLNIVNKRTDGYHDIETVFYPVKINDAIEVIEKKKVQFSISGLPIEGDQENNLSIKAFYLLKEDFPQLPSIHLHLHKTIPMGAGLGGGSADGAFTLKLLSKKFDLHLSEKQLMDYSLQLGSDCPFFIPNKPCFATGRGELLEKIDLDLSRYKIVIVHPCVHVSTSWAFSNIKPATPGNSVREIIKQPIETWKEALRNDFEGPVFTKYPEIKKIKEDLYTAKAIYSSMSGSGSAVYGFFEKDKPISLSFPENYFIKELGG